MAIHRYPKVTFEQSCLFDSLSKATIFEMAIDLLKARYGETEVNENFFEVITKAESESEVQATGLDKAISKAKKLHAHAIEINRKAKARLAQLENESKL